MRFLADECVDGRLITRLRAAGHDVLAVGVSMRGARDPLVLDQATQDGRVLLTEDTDFGDLVIRHHHRSAGVVLLREVQDDLDRVFAALLQAIAARGDDLHRLFTVIDADRVRVRRLGLANG